MIQRGEPMKRFLKLDKTTSQDLSEGDLDYTTDFGSKFKLEKILIQANVAITETITITVDSVHGSAYDAVIAKENLIGKQSYVFKPSAQENYQAGDQINIKCSNANATGVVYVTVKSSET